MSRFLLVALATASAFACQPGFRFEANLGQVDPSIRYVARTRGAAVAFTESAVRFPAASLHFAGERPGAHWQPADPLVGTSSYFIGDDPSRWIRNAPHYGRLARRAIYPGIDVVFYGNGDTLEFDFLVSPHADPAQIRLAWPAGARLAVASSGDLNIEAEGYRTVLRKPAAYQTIAGRRISVPGRFEIETAAGEVRFEVAGYDRNYALTIDPIVDAWSFLGGTSDDRITVVLPGLVAGVTTSKDLYAYSPIPRGKDIFVWRGQSYSLYGGSGDEEPTSAARAGNRIVLAGWTSSRDFPLRSSTSLQPAYGGGARDGFVIVNPDYSGGQSSYLGGSGDDAILAVSADPAVRDEDLGAYYAAGETNSPDFPVREPIQPAPGGGTDGFLTRIMPSGAIAESTYLGGAGDDAILALDASAQSCWVGGRTKSSDLPGVNARPAVFRNLQDRRPFPDPAGQYRPQNHSGGGADGFLIRLDKKPGRGVGFASFFGGSADDEIRALHIAPDGWVWAGGVTASPDLPVTEASQSTALGDTDAWIGRFHPGGGGPSFVTYLGGSGHDELSAISHDRNGELYVAGWTTSTDLRVVDFLQDRAGGGEDAFLARLDRNGFPQMLTYLGGPDNDRLSALATGENQHIYAGGQSQSAGIPAFALKPAAAAAGLIDGLYLEFHQNGIYASDLVIGKDLTATLNVELIGSATGLPVTVRSSDPALVSVRGGALAFGGPFEITGNAADGRAELILSVPGLPARRVGVRLRPSYLVNAYTDEVPVLANNSITLSFATATTHPDSGEVIYQKARAGFDSGISYRTNQPAVIQVRDAANSYQSTLGATVRGVAEGPAFVTIASAVLPVLGPRDVRVRVVKRMAPALVMKDAAVGRFLQTALPVSFAANSIAGNTSFEVRFTSEDPLKVLLSAKPGDAGAASLTISFAASTSQPPSIWVRGRASSGVVRLRAEVNGAAPVYVKIALAPSVIGLATPAQTNNIVFGDVVRDLTVTTSVLDVWSTRTLFAVIAAINGPVPAGFAVGTQLPSPEATNSFSVLSSNPAVLVANFAGLTFNLGTGQAYIPFYANLMNQGTALLSVSASGFDSAGPISVTVRPRNLPLTVTETALGKDLSTFIGFRTPYDFPQNVTVTVTSSDPSRLLVSQYQIDEAAKISVRAVPGSGYQGDGFWISALAASGDVTVTLEAPGFQSRTLVVHLAPTTYRLTPSSVTATLGGQVRINVEPTFRGATVDYQRHVRSAVTPTFTLSSSNPAVIPVDSPTVTLRGAVAYLLMTSVGVGTAELTLTGTGGSAVDPQGARATATITPKQFTTSAGVLALGKDLQRELPRDGSFGPSTAGLVFRSQDPSRVLLSREPRSAGVQELDNSAPVYVQALADSGDAYISVRAAGYDEGRIRVLLYPTAFGFLDSSGIPARLAGAVGSVFNLRIAPVPVDPASGNPVFASGLTLRGGLDALEVRVKASDPAVGRVFSPVGFMGGMGENTVQFRADANGITELSVEPPPGFADAGRVLRRRIEIGAPRLSLAGITLGKDMQYSHRVTTTSLGTGTVPVTITSSDPRRVLVCASAQALGQGSVTVSAGTAFYVQALEGSGDVTLTATASGFETATAAVHLEPSYFAFSRGSSSDYPHRVSYKASFAPPIYLSHPSYDFSGNKLLRPGLGTITVPVDSSDESILSVKSPVVFTEGRDTVYGSFEAGEVGTATVRVGAPPGFILGPDKDRTVTVEVKARTFRLDSANIGQDRVVSIGYFPALEYSTSVRVVSSDSSRVLLSVDPKVAGSREVVFDADPKNSTTIYAHGLVSEGRADVTATASGFETGTAQMTLHRSGYLFPYEAVRLSAGASTTVGVRTSDGQQLRPGIPPVTLIVDSTDTAVAVGGDITLQPGDNTANVKITAKSPGTAVLTIRSNGAVSGMTNLVVTVPAS